MTLVPSSSSSSGSLPRRAPSRRPHMCMRRLASRLKTLLQTLQVCLCGARISSLPSSMTSRRSRLAAGGRCRPPRCGGRGQTSRCPFVRRLGPTARGEALEMETSCTMMQLSSADTICHNTE
jgi:hypothetical protein